MKTIDFLVQELPKLGGWPDGAIGAGFLCGEGTLYFWDESNDCPTKWRVDTEAEVEDSASEISREQYEAALAAKNDGWIEWGGGECPVECGTVVDVKYRCGAVSENQQAWPKHHKESDVMVNPLSNAGQAFWRHENSVMDIIAYRLHKPQEAEQAKADDEADMNECIGQTPAAEWNGEGLPPVGCECEFMKHTLDAIPNWRRGIIKYVSEYTVVIVEALSPGEFVAHPRTCDFRPIISESERKRDDICDKIYGAMTNAKRKDNRSDMAEEIYDAIASGKIPGLRLED